MNSSRKKITCAVTLVEVMVVVLLLGLLFAFFLGGGTKMLKQSKGVQTQYLLGKVAESLRLFKSDWGELPTSTSYLINLDQIKGFADAKGVALASPKPYIDDTIPTTKGIGKIWACPSWDPDDPGNIHAHHVGKPWFAVGVLKTCRQAGGHPSHSVKIELRDVTGVGDLVPADLWGNMIYYTKTDDGFKLISPGPDGKISSVNGTLTEWAQASANYVGSGDEDKDNVLFVGKT